VRVRTHREDIQEPEPPISEDYEGKLSDGRFVFNSKELYGNYNKEDE